jgi:hypothetical protein
VDRRHQGSIEEGVGGRAGKMRQATGFLPALLLASSCL